jgi:hypothetical protein
LPLAESSFMIAFEFKELVEVTTPKGVGYIWYMIDYGPHSDTLYTIILRETGECWQMSHKDFRIRQNLTMGIGGSYREKAPSAEEQAAPGKLHNPDTEKNTPSGT